MQKDTLKETARILREAAGLVRRGWTTRALARDTDGQAVGPALAAACQWCAVGAVVAAADDSPYGPEFPETSGGREAVLRIVRQLGVRNASALNAADIIGQWNDGPGRTMEEVAATIEAAADEAEVALEA